MAAPSAMKLFANNLDIWNLATIAGSSPKMALLTSTAALETHDGETGWTVYADLTNELATGNGYTAGGVALASPMITTVQRGVKFSTGGAIWTASGSGIPAWRYAVIYFEGVLWGVTNPLLCWCYGDSTPANMALTAAGKSLHLSCSSDGWVTFTVPSTLPTIGGQTVFTADDEWNIDVSGRATDSAMTTKLNAQWTTDTLAVVFGYSRTDVPGLPTNIVPANQPMVSIDIYAYPSEGDPGPAPFPGPDDIWIQGGAPPIENPNNDRHVLVCQPSSGMIYEGYGCYYDTSWHCAGFCKWDMTQRSYGQRPIGWTSADASGMPMICGVLRYAEAATGSIRHALRAAIGCTADAYVYPASHGAFSNACSPSSNWPPLGVRVRLNNSYDISGFSTRNQVILTALKKYGIFITDNNPGHAGLVLYGDCDPGWSDDDLYDLWNIPMSQFEAVVTPSIP